MWNHLPDNIAFSRLLHGGYWEDETKWVEWNQFEFHQLVHWTNWFSSLLIFLLSFCEYIGTRHALMQKFEKGDKGPESLSVLWHVVSITKAEDHILCPSQQRTHLPSEEMAFKFEEFLGFTEITNLISASQRKLPSSFFFGIIYSLERWFSWTF